MLTDGEQTSGCLAIEDMLDSLVRKKDHARHVMDPRGFVICIDL